MESFKYNDCDMNRKGIKHLQIECPFGVGKREQVWSWTLLGSVPVRKSEEKILWEVKKRK